MNTNMVWNSRILSPTKRILRRDTSTKLSNNHRRTLRNYLHSRPSVVLGIESSCDDTGCGIVDDKGNILGEALNSQQLLHLKHGGIIPTIAKGIHIRHITAICEQALKAANLRLRDIDAVAATTKPGMSLSLNVGTEFGKYLSRISGKPFIPIHHMEAHALTVRMKEKVDFPYLVLLVSGGHSLLAIVENVDQFYLLGRSLDNSPGEIIDKVARRMKLRNIPEFSALSGGHAIEMAARKATNFEQFEFGSYMMAHRNCDFSFSGPTGTCVGHIIRQEIKHGINGDMTIPDIYNLCGAFQLAVTQHICHRVQRAMEFVDGLPSFPEENRTLVISGGMACNDFLAKALEITCSELEFRLVRTPPRLCNDNGVMIAWNGMERWFTDKGVIRDPEEIEGVKIQAKAPLGEDWTNRVTEKYLKCKWVKIRKKLL